ncbi:ankyrin-3 isoform X1 [Octopus sinensis]|uniref:Ankyrin-3 isoform X1 n=1 Tax=Octopus sinensis TaxID=2607531 RepID=A0A7E6FKP8_9MOLL|nr:ankyrin-3 isoform X1 [Octopus sinensis]XP_036368254.1 ankyrin-3 isoform X1 [Octopus sinensis]
MGQAVSRQEKFWEACGYGRISEVRKFLEEGSVDVNWVSYTHDCCPIHVASQGKMEIVKMLLEAGSKVNVKDNRGNLPLHHAAMKGHTAIIDILMENGSEINVQDKNGWSPLHCAAYWCHLEAAEALIAHGADISLLNKDERSALHETCRSPEDDESKLGKIANLFIAKGSDVNAKSSDEGEVSKLADFTPLMFAAYHGHPCVAQALINADCEIQAYGTNGWTALHWATDRDQKEVVYLLLEAGCDPTVKGERGELASERTKDKELKSALRNAEKMFKELSILDEADKALKKNQNANGSAAVPIGNSHQTGAMISPTESDKVLLSVSSVSSRSAPLVEEEPTGVSDNEDDDYINCSKKEEIFNNCQINDIKHDDYEKNSESNATDLMSDKLSLNEGEIR